MLLKSSFTLSSLLIDKILTATSTGIRSTYKRQCLINFVLFIIRSMMYQPMYRSGGKQEALPVVEKQYSISAGSVVWAKHLTPQL